MDRETIIKLAREAGLIDFRDALSSHYVQAVLDNLEHFAKLVAEHVIKSAPDYKMGYADGVAVEREACAKVVEDWDSDSLDPRDGAAAIRARGNT
jgi:hypothetical protein